MLECIAKAGLTEKLNSLPDKFNTHVSKSVFLDGIELSGGETQRLMLARALYKDAPIIILDEPTASLDPIAESDLYNKYNDLTGNRTSVYISHRLASTRFCDRVLLIENGVISEQGTHEQLVKQGGKYSDLYEIQSHYYRYESAQTGLVGAMEKG
jgi:ATP-binding cassette subfamily B protein